MITNELAPTIIGTRFAFRLLQAMLAYARKPAPRVPTTPSTRRALIGKFGKHGQLC